MHKILFFFFVGLVSLSCAQKPSEQTVSEDNPNNPIQEKEVVVVYKNVLPAEAEDLLLDTNVVILDVRTPEEFATGHLIQAQNLDIMNPAFNECLSTLDKQKTYLVYCKSGGRSARAMAKMEELGFTTVCNMQGGITAWQAAKKPME